MEAATALRRRIAPGRRQGEQVSPLELFFDLVFVLALTQCTQLMADKPTWEGLAQGLLVLALLWWSWTAYAWLTSVLDPDSGLVRGVIFVAMGALLICSICVPGSFEDLGLWFVLGYGVVRFAHIGLFVIASRDEPEFRRSVIFGRNDLVQDAPISHVDILLCRNTLMYFNADTQAQILSRCTSRCVRTASSSSGRRRCC